MEKDQCLELAKVDEIPLGKMKRVEVNGKDTVMMVLHDLRLFLKDRLFSYSYDAPKVEHRFPYHNYFYPIGSVLH